MLFALLGLSLASAFVIQPQAAVEEAPVLGNAASTYAYGVDLAVYTSQSTFSCMRGAGYNAVFIRGYNPAGSGSYDNNAHQNVKNAYAAGIGTEVYMTPQPLSSKSAATQMSEQINGLTNNGVTIRSIWIQVTSPVNWSSSYSSNVNFISGLISAAQQRGLAVGIYTSVYDWNQITNNWTGAGSNTMLWYWNVYGTGVSGESPANFSDFRAFGSFKQATVKQFGQVESVCSTTVNRDVFVSSSSSFVMSEGMARYEGPVVGHIGL